MRPVETGGERLIYATRDPQTMNFFLFCYLPRKFLGQIPCSCLIFRMRRGREGLPEIYAAACMPDRPFLLGLPIFCVSAAHMTARRQIYREGGLHPVSISPAFFAPFVT